MRPCFFAEEGKPSFNLLRKYVGFQPLSLENSLAPMVTLNETFWSVQLMTVLDRVVLMGK